MLVKNPKKTQVCFTSYQQPLSPVLLHVEQKNAWTETSLLKKG